MIPRDGELLRLYCRERSQDAFTQLVERHLDLVYAAALRQSGNKPQVAERITQTVFTDLAKQAKSLQEHPSLAGWLYSHAQNAESDSGTQQPKGTSQSGQAHSPSGRTSTEQLDPVIGEAIDKLEESDRQALLLHYRDGLDFRTVGAVLGMPDDQARQRIIYAFEELRRILRDGGRTSGATLKTLATVLLASGLVKPPVGLARRIVKTALAEADAVSSLASLWQTNQMKGALAALCLLALLAALIVARRSRGPTTEGNSAVRDQVVMNRPVPERNRQSPNLASDGSELQQLRKDKRELLRLRAELTELRQQATNPPRATPAEADPEPPAKVDHDSPVVTYFSNVSAKLARGQTMLTGGWKTESGKRTVLLVTPEISDGDAGAKQINFQTIWVAAPDGVLTELGLDKLFTDSRTNDVAQLLSEPQTRTLMAGLVGGAGVDVLTAPRLTTMEGMLARIDVRQTKTEGDVTVQVGPAVELTPKVGADGSLDLALKAQFGELPRTETEADNPELPVPDPIEEDTDEP